MEDKPVSNSAPKKNSPSKKPFVGYLLAGVVAAIVSVVLYAGGQYVYQTFYAGKNPNVFDNPVAAEIPELDTLKKTSQGFRAVSKMLGPAVVHIKVEKEVKDPFAQFRRGGGGRGGGRGRGQRDQFFDFFFGNPRGPGMPGAPGGPPEEPQTAEAMGSGFVIDKRGYLVTNNHVVEGATKVTVTFPGDNQTEISAKVVGRDPKTDLAVLKIKPPKGMAIATWADSEQVEVGDWAIAIGSPFSLRHSVTVGIVSAKGRNSRTIGAEYGHLLQTDAAINPGNSGGPLCTLDGQVMGVNTAIYSKSGGYMGIGFAIPAVIAKDVTSKLIKDGKVIRGWLGVMIQQPKPELLKYLGIKTGVAVHRVMPDSPAQKAGLKAGEIVISVNGTAVKDVEELQRKIAKFQPGENVKVAVINSGTKKKRNVTVKIGRLPDKPGAEEEEEAPVPEENAKPDKIGLVVTKSKSGKGVRVAFVKPGAPGYQVGMEVGDLIMSVGGKPMTSPAAYKKAVAKGGILTFDVERKGQSLWFQLFVGD